jgi:hypothetical protein
MTPLAARAVLCLIFGFFIYETINEFNKLFNLSLNPYLGIIPAVLFGVFQEFVIKKRNSNLEAFDVVRSSKARFDKILFFAAWLLAASLFFASLIVWAGAMYKQITKGADGSHIFH